MAEIPSSLHWSLVHEIAQGPPYTGCLKSNGNVGSMACDAVRLSCNCCIVAQSCAIPVLLRYGSTSCSCCLQLALQAGNRNETLQTLFEVNALASSNKWPACEACDWQSYVGIGLPAARHCPNESFMSLLQEPLPDHVTCEGA